MPQIESWPRIPAPIRNHLIERELRLCHYDERDIFSIKLALEEALINAIKHGNQMDRAKRVHIQYCIDKDRFDIEYFQAAVKKYPGKLAFLGGGATLDILIQQSLRSGDAGPEVQRKFRESAEDIHFEFAPDGVKRQNLQGPGRQDSRVAYEKIDAAFILNCDFARPSVDGGFVSNVALA